MSIHIGRQAPCETGTEHRHTQTCSSLPGHLSSPLFRSESGNHYVAQAGLEFIGLLAWVNLSKIGSYSIAQASSKQSIYYPPHPLFSPPNYLPCLILCYSFLKCHHPGLHACRVLQSSLGQPFATSFLRSHKPSGHVPALALQTPMNRDGYGYSHGLTRGSAPC